MVINWFVSIWYNNIDRTYHQHLIRARTIADAHHIQVDYHQDDMNKYGPKLYPVEDDGTYWNGNQFIQLNEHQYRLVVR